MNNNLIPAATVLVLKDSDVGMEVLMVKRSKDHLLKIYMFSQEGK